MKKNGWKKRKGFIGGIGEWYSLRDSSITFKKLANVRLLLYESGFSSNK